VASKLLFVRDLAPNMAVDTPFLVRKVERKMTKPNARSESKPYLALELADKTGVVAGRVWNDALPFVEDTMMPDTVVNIQGTTQDYGGEISLVITDATAMPEATLDDYVPTSPRDRAQMRREYTGLALTVGSTDLANLLQTFIQSADFEEFCKAPAAATEAYAYLGGLLEHTLGVAQMSLAIATSRSDIDTDLLLTAALLHDLGKVDAFSLMSFAPGDDLQLLDAPALALVRLDRLVDAAGGVGDPARLKLYHAVATADTRGAFGQTQPQTKEAVILQSMNQLDLVLAAASTPTGDGAWTETIRSLRRRFYRGNAAATAATTATATDNSSASGELTPLSTQATQATLTDQPDPSTASTGSAGSIWDDAPDDDEEIPF